MEEQTRIQKSSEMTGEPSTPGAGGRAKHGMLKPRPPVGPKEHPFLEAFPTKFLVTWF